MKPQKKKLNVIRPTLRHKKYYFKVLYSKDYLLSIHSLLLKNYEKSFGLFSAVECNLTVMKNDALERSFIVRINRVYEHDFLSSLFFLNSELGLIFVQRKGSTLRSLE